MLGYFAGTKKGRIMLPGFVQNHSKHVQEDDRNQCRTELDGGKMASRVLQILLAYTEGNKKISWDPGHAGPYLILYLYNRVANGHLSFQTGFSCILKFPPTK